MRCKTYRNLFSVIYKELNEKDKQEIYKREINELTFIKNDINLLRTNIESRLKAIEEISKLNDILNSEIVYNNNIKNEFIINEISNKIEILRENTIDVCSSMKKLKYELNGIKHLNKYDIDIISEKYNFDKNYIIKMKGELNFLKEGYAKYYFNIKDDQTPFLLKASEKSDMKNNNQQYIHLVPLKEEKRYNIMECIYYIYQELIAYQNEKVNNNNLRRISPLKKNIENNVKHLKIINGKDEQSNINNINNSYKLILKKSNSDLNNNLMIQKKENINKNNIINISQNFVYSKKKFLTINKNGNNLLLNQFRIQKKLKNEKSNISVGLQYKNPLIIPKTFSKKSEIIKKKNYINNNLNENDKKINFLSENDKTDKNNDKIEIDKKEK